MQIIPHKSLRLVSNIGFIGDVGYIRGYRAHVDEVAERAGAAKAAGASADAAPETVFQAISARYPDRNSIGMVVGMAYAGTP